MKTIIFTFVLCLLWLIGLTMGKNGYGTFTSQQSITALTTEPDTIPKVPDPEMVLVEGGNFTMGLMRNETGLGFGKTTRAHPVSLSGFKIAKYEITQAEWESIMGDSLNFSLNQGCANCPVEEVSWNDIQLFVRKLNSLTGKHYQLPTEAQWEFAARGGIKSKGYKYACSDFADEVISPANQFTFRGKTLPVGHSKPNELGIYNTSGNVAEWCQDWFDPDYKPATQKNPAGSSSGFGHIIRGGSWGINPSECDVNSFRTGYPNDRDAHVGFRLVLIP